MRISTNPFNLNPVWCPKQVAQPPSLDCLSVWIHWKPDILLQGRQISHTLLATGNSERQTPPFVVFPRPVFPSSYLARTVWKLKAAKIESTYKESHPGPPSSCKAIGKKVLPPKRGNPESKENFLVHFPSFFPWLLHIHRKRKEPPWQVTQNRFYLLCLETFGMYIFTATLCIMEKLTLQCRYQLR